MPLKHAAHLSAGVGLQLTCRWLGRGQRSAALVVADNAFRDIEPKAYLRDRNGVLVR